ncbi:MAG: C25 family cysteine peptidase [Bacteroidia bacterium]
MKKLYVAFLVFALAVSDTFAQNPNSWIVFGTNNLYSEQQYVKIKIWQEGIYRLSFSDITQFPQFFPPGNFDPRRLQIFHEGKEQAILVSGEADGMFDSTDYVEFYGKPNDGTFDTQLYDSAYFHVNPYYSLFNDTSAYFLTLNIAPLAQNKRMIPAFDSNFLNYPIANYVMNDAVQSYHSEYNSGYRKPYVEVSIDASYSNGEGWSGVFFGTGGLTLNLSTPKAYGGTAPAPIASTVIMGTNHDGYMRDWKIEVGLSILINSVSYLAYTVTPVQNTINISSLMSGTAEFKFTSNSTTPNTERNTVPFVRVVYPRILNFTAENSAFQKFTIPAYQFLNKTRLDISGFLPGNSATRWLYVFSGDSIYKVNVDSGSVYQALAPTYGSDKFALLITDASTITTGGFTMAPISYDANNPGKFHNYNHASVTNSDYLIVTHSSLMAEANSYKVHRQSAAGGSFNVLLTDIGELYDQFAWGIEKNPLSIRNFAKFTIDTFDTVPKYIFLIGKSLYPHIPRVLPVYFPLDLVPTYGDPASDMLMVSRFSPDTVFHPAIAIGRLAARTPADVTMFLNKMIEHDAAVELSQTDPQEWMKQVLHFGGGRYASEQGTIADHLDEYKRIIEDTLFAGHVTTFLKTSTDPIQPIVSTYLQNLIDTGVTLMTFFSHAAGSTFDINTDAPTNYHNTGRYPVILANSCFIGDIHVPNRQASEDFILQPSKGAIGFIASPNTGYISDQYAYGLSFYKQLSYYSYGQGIGDCMKNCIDAVWSSGLLAEEYKKSVTMGMTLHGDPAMRLYNQQKPDLAISKPGISFTPAQVTTDLASFTINVAVKNLGRDNGQDNLVRIIRKYPDGYPERIFDTLLSGLPFLDTLKVTIPMDFVHAAGKNTFIVEVDFPHAIDEIKENNNLEPVDLIILSSDIVPVYPAKYSIVPIDSINVKGSTSNLFSAAKPYRFEIDTTDRFNSQALRVTVITSTGGIVQWPLPFKLIPNKVYYWRTANDSITSADTTISSRYSWNESSFIHIPGKTGWSQAHYSQFKEDKFQNIIYRNNYWSLDTTFTFVDIASKIWAKNSLTPYADPTHPVEFGVDFELRDYAGCDGSIHIAIFDPITLENWTTADHYLGNFNQWDPVCYCGYTCGGGQPGRSRPDNFFTFYFNAPQQMLSLQHALEDSIPNGHYVLAYSYKPVHYEMWGSLLQTFQDTLGSQYITPVDTPQWWQPFILITQMGDTSETIEILGDSINTDIYLEKLIGGNWDKGFITSVTIGPAASWTELHWDHFNIEGSSPPDVISLDVIGIKANGDETVLIDDLSPIYADSVLSNVIIASQYPYLKLEAYLQDEVNTNPPQLIRWQIYYEEVPEGALNPNRHLVPNPLVAELQQGNNYNFAIAFENITNVNFSDSMLVDFFLIDANNTRVNISSPKYDTLNAGDYLIASTTFSTLNHPGTNTLWIEVNPRNDQPEQQHFNNLASWTFNVSRDITNPILDITFDGQHILDGDIVSAKPFIEIKLKDENQFLALNDTNKYNVIITDPSGKLTAPSFELAPYVSTDNSRIKWTPAVLPDNSFKMEYNPGFPEDGIYFLEVQASDESGNLSGKNSYKISFEVINRPTITEFVNYPNPFSTSTRFVFVLTGSEVPQELLIQILTVSGKIVREITQEEIGPIHIGRNISQYAWDGKDSYGDQLANGVYFYRVQTRLNKKSIEHRETEADKFFKKGFGKMYLMR